MQRVLHFVQKAHGLLAWKKYLLDFKVGNYGEVKNNYRNLRKKFG